MPTLNTMAKEDNVTTSGYLERQVLIAMPGMVDGNFAGSVTLLCQHNDNGAIGITINRLSDFSLGEILAQLHAVEGRDDVSQPGRAGHALRPWGSGKLKRVAPRGTTRERVSQFALLRREEIDTEHHVLAQGLL